ncbi:hypothetical protein [Marvinbryantia formatexigens]|uniref:hypothetical protein n=1 Tax=Marvinbryantia formatexigens TaxID=168384 RepID=UPI0002FEBBEB|nr:hypothetical protein [Marvinbryantia formatexigens]UWO24276.1 hypothetical protein NQ534_17905 [Marvinbryantia formatexigens DSM 14469]SDF56458.1 hypothetical protein SAMN05660368_00928 [Marvinbryantia formatexigens]
MGQTEKDGKNNKVKILIAVLLLVTAVAIGVTVWALFFRSTTPVLSPDYAPVEEEVNAETIEAETEEKMEADEGGGAVSMSYQKTVTISLADQTASLMFQNPSKSVNDMVLQLIIVGADGTETVIAQSGTLHPGKQVEKLELIDGAATLSAGTYSGKFNVLYYDPDTGERAIVNGSIEGIEITVTE